MPVPPVALEFAKRGLPTPHSNPPPMNLRVHWSVWIWSVFLPGFLIAAEPPADEMALRSPPAVVKAADKQPLTAKPAGRAKPPPTPEQKRKMVVLTSLFIAGILTILLCLLLWIVWWSRRTHRLLRAPLPATNRGDELWYLKAKRFPNQAAQRPGPDSPPAPPPT